MLRGCFASGSPDTQSPRAAVQVSVSGRPRFTGDLVALVAGHGVEAALGSAFRTRGLRLLDDVHGAFAIAVFDPSDGSGLLAVDRIGIDTLCFAEIGGMVHFASDAADLAARLRDGRIDTASLGGLDPQAIFDYLYFHCIPGPATIYRGVTRLLAGHAMRIGSSGMVVEAYWTPHYVENARTPVAALEATFLQTVKSSVAHAIDGATRPGCFLSGGTDSSTVAGMLREVTGAAPETYSIGFDADGFDEMSFARIASKRFATNHHEYYITPADLVDSIPKIAATYEQPFGNSSVLPTYYCARMAASDGIDRLLGGDGGDELFGGNARYATQKVFDYFDRAPGAVRSVLRATLMSPSLADLPVVGKARSYVQQAGVPMPDRTQTYNLLTRIGISTIFEADFLAQVDQDHPLVAMRATYLSSAAKTLLNRMLEFDLKYTLTDNDLPKVVTACRLAGVEVAFPLLDDDLFAFAERLDPGLKLKGFQLRWFFKHALRDFLPPEILTKSKHGFGLPFGIWLGRDPALKDLAFSSLDALKGRGIVRAAFIDQLRGDLVADHATYYGELVWVLMMLEQWLQTHSHAANGAP